MPFESVWTDLRKRCESLDPDTVLVTPRSERPFTVALSYEDRLVVRYRETGEERTLWRDQFALLHDRLADGRDLSLDALAPGVEPYVSVLSLAPGYVVEDGALRAVEAEGTRDERSPFLKPDWAVRPTPERVRDDARLLSARLQRTAIDEGAPADLVDLYVLLSDVQRGADELRREIGATLLDHIGPGGRLRGRFGTVTRSHRERRQVKEEAEVFAALDAHDVPREWVTGVDPEKLDVVVAATDVTADEVYEVEEDVYVQKTGVDEAEKQSRLQGLVERLDDLDDEEAERLHHDIDELEARIERLDSAE